MPFSCDKLEQVDERGIDLAHDRRLRENDGHRVRNWRRHATRSATAARCGHASGQVVRADLPAGAQHRERAGKLTRRGADVHVGIVHSVRVREQQSRRHNRASRTCLLAPMTLSVDDDGKDRLSYRCNRGTRLHLWRDRDGCQHQFVVTDPFSHRRHPPPLIFFDLHWGAGVHRRAEGLCCPSLAIHPFSKGAESMTRKATHVA